MENRWNVPTPATPASGFPPLQVVFGFVSGQAEQFQTKEWTAAVYPLIF